MPRPLALVVAACAIVLTILAAGLRPDAFFVGDSGVKLTVARNALRSPAHPLDIPLPHVAAARVPYVEPFFAVHDDHSHAVTSEAFPLITAPLLRAFGMRGLYVLPALGFIAAIAGCAWLASVLDTRREPAIVAATAALGTPFMFYGLEFWEHMPAVALAVLGTALMLDAARRRPGRHSPTVPALVAGLLMGAAIVLRPEAAVFTVIVLPASRMLVHRPTWRSLIVTAAGALMALAPLELYTLLHFGSLVPAHVGANANLMGEDWGAGRVRLAAEWLIPSRWTADGPVNRSSFWSIGPAALLAVASVARPGDHRERPFLWTVALLTIALTVLSAPNAGGGQWGPRYLLFAYVPLALLGADLLDPLPRGRVAVAALVIVALACAWVQRASYRQLRGSKAAYGRIVDFVAANTEAGGNVVTDLWWLDQAAAAALENRNVLFAPDAKSGAGIVRWLSESTVPSVTVFRSREESSDIDDWSAPTCYFVEGRDELPLRGLVAVRLRHRCGYKP